MHKCRSYDGLDKLIYVTFKCDLTFNLPKNCFKWHFSSSRQIIFKSMHKRSSWHRQIRTHAYTQAHTPYKTCNSYRLSHNQMQIFVSSEVKNKVLAFHSLYVLSYSTYVLVSEIKWFFSETKMLTFSFEIKRWFLKEKEKSIHTKC